LLRDVEETRDSICKWLVINDPSSNHNRAWGLHEPHTGNWVTHSPDYENWLRGATSFLWLHGIPGSGKTVLASFIIENVKEFCKKAIQINTGWAYYYFYFSREQDEAPHFLRWTINQLCRQSNHIPTEAHDLYRAREEPIISSLLAALAAVLEDFERAYLVIDALDESSNRSRVLDILLHISNHARFKKLQICAVSRREIDIEKALEDISTKISLHNDLVDQDIRSYAQGLLQRHSRLSKWPENLKREIETAVVEGAKGMYVLYLT
jgi:hypothetical protein